MTSLLFLHALLLPELLPGVPFCLGVGTLGQGEHLWRRPPPVDANKDLTFLFGGAAEPQRCGGILFTLPGLERKCLQMAGACTATLS